MAKDLGWIKLHRSSFNNKLYFSEPFTRWQAWVDLLLIANHIEGYIRIRGIKQSVLRGQVGFSSTKLSKRWTWSKGKVIRYLNELADEHQIVMQKNNITTLISIVNYNKYQNEGMQIGMQNDTQTGTHSDTQTDLRTDTNKNIKNNKEDNNKYIPTGVLPLEFYPIYSDYNGLPSKHSENIIRLVKVTKQVDIDKDDVKALWEVFKEQNLTGTKGYNSDADIYRHFTNWANKQSFRKKSVPKKQKDTKNIIGVKFINDFKQCEMSDGSIQDLTKNQIDGATYNQINPNSIVKK